MGPHLALSVLLLYSMGYLVQGCKVANLVVEVEENTPAPHPLTTITTDSGVTAFVSGTEAALFEIRDNRLSLLVEVDYEVTKVLRVQVVCRNSASVVGTQDVVVTILNVNDNPPIFTPTQYNLTIPEDEKIGTAIGPAIVAEDADKDTLFYELSGPDPIAAAYFRLLSVNNPIIQVNERLDYDMYSSIQLILTARDTANPGELVSHTATATINIIIEDADNKPPQFLPCRQLGNKVCINDGYTASINRSEVATGVLKLTPAPLYAVDGDVGINTPIMYEIVSGNNDNIFIIDQVSGNLTMNKAVDSLRTIILHVMAYQEDDKSKYTITTVQIEVKDKNDYPPTFISNYYLGETHAPTPIGVFVNEFGGSLKPLHVFAEDNDFPDKVNPDIIYKIQNSSDFSITREGYILTNAAITSPTVIAFSVLATDRSTGEEVTTIVSVNIIPGTTTTTTLGTGTTTTTTPGTGTTTTMTSGTGTTTTTTPGTGSTTTTTPGTGTTTSTTPGTGTTTSTTLGKGTTISTTTGTGTTTTTTAGTGTTISTTPGTGTTTSTTVATGTTTTTTHATGTTTGTTPSTGTTSSTTPGTGTTTSTTPRTGTTTSTTTGTGTTLSTTTGTGTTTSTTTRTGPTTSTTHWTGPTTSIPPWTGSSTTTTIKTSTTKSTIPGTAITKATTHGPGATHGTDSIDPTTTVSRVTISPNAGSSSSLAPSTSLPGPDDVNLNKIYTPTDMAAVGASLGAVLAVCLVGLGFLIYKQYGENIRDVLKKNGSGGSNDRLQHLIDEETGDNRSSGSNDNPSNDVEYDIINQISEEPVGSALPISVAAVASLLSADNPVSEALGDESDSEDKKGVKSILTKEFKEDAGYKSVWFMENAEPEVVVIEGVEEGEADDNDDQEEYNNQDADDDDDEDDEDVHNSPTML